MNFYNRHCYVVINKKITIYSLNFSISRVIKEMRIFFNNIVSNELKFFSILQFALEED